MSHARSVEVDGQPFTVLPYDTNAAGRWLVSATSAPGAYYITRADPAGCTCPAGIHGFRHARRGYCKHVAALRVALSGQKGARVSTP